MYIYLLIWVEEEQSKLFDADGRAMMDDMAKTKKS